ncbi:MAG: AAA family ATPase [Bacteroidetes bacterium]|nr:AAA family ATPase [Bacteroidota bacterium]
MNSQLLPENKIQAERMDEHSFALSFALETDQPIFLTGKAGSGKTTLLKQIAEKTTKNFVIAAPTGVAAINAGGVTIHSIFHLPLTCLIPSHDYVDANIAANRGLLVSHLRFSKEKKKVLEELELLIIDEVSMVRADILDGVDFALQFVRRNKRPFGGVQVLLIGDMHQLPPVTRDHEWELLKSHYRSPYFFDSLVWQRLEAVQIELKKIYRQQDEKFVSVLNNIRDKQLEEEDFEQLEKRYKPGFKPDEEGYVLLTTHNRKADSVNQHELQQLKGKMHSFPASIEGEFPESMFPCDPNLQLKEGAQVMFIKNDVESGKYFNGKLAKVKSIFGDTITVTFNDTKEDFELFRERWENINYNVDKETGKIEKQLLGTYNQYPLRLSWAITIHKSQGLTFDKVIIDAGQSFAAGQVYVALSRCRTLEGIILHSRITQSALFTDEKINSFSQSHHKTSALQTALEAARTRYANELLKRLFNFEKFPAKLIEWKENILDKEIPGKESVLDLNEKLQEQSRSLLETSLKFENQLQNLLYDFTNDSEKIAALKERCNKAIDYFTEAIFTSLITPLHGHIQSFAFKAKVKKYVKLVQEIEDFFWIKINHLYNARFLNEKIHTGEIVFKKEMLKTAKTSNTTAKKEKGSTFNDTLTLYKEGKTIAEISTIRSLKASTIKSHFAKWILTGDIDINKVMNSENIVRLEKFVLKNGHDNYAAFKTEIGHEFDYNDLRMVVNHLSFKRKTVGAE